MVPPLFSARAILSAATVTEIIRVAKTMYDVVIADTPPATQLVVPRALSIPWPATWIILLSLSAVINVIQCTRYLIH